MRIRLIHIFCYQLSAHVPLTIPTNAAEFVRFTNAYEQQAAHCLYKSLDNEAVR